MAASKIDVTKHILVPKHTKLTQEETKKVLDEFNISAKQLPRILVNDAAIENLKCKEGDVIKIDRKSLTAGHSTFYRCVVNA